MNLLTLIIRKNDRERRIMQSGLLDLHIPIGIALCIYIVYAVFVYWPVLAHQRFFWEDFSAWEYPVREYSYYMLGLKHTLPFWNPFSWGWETFLSDAEAGFWYPANFFQIVLVRLFLPDSYHLPILAPELTTIAHMPLAAVGMFCLLRRKFQVSDAISLLAGLTFGFGARMVAEQNHGMFVVQFSLLPWETLLLMKSWESWRSAIALGLVFGASFLAGQQQFFIFIALFLGSFTLWETFRRNLLHATAWDRIRPLCLFSLAMTVVTGVSAIQLLPMLEHSNLTLRTHLNFHDASMGSLNPVRVLGLFIPKVFGENAGSALAQGFKSGNGMWYWEGTLYWGVLAEICAIFGMVRLWTNRKSGTTMARHLPFFLAYAIFAIAYGLGKYLGIQWLFWRFVPFFDHIRMPSRMLIFIWFLGVLATAFGMDELIKNTNTSHYKKMLVGISLCFVVLNLLATTGILNYFMSSRGYIVNPLLTLHSLIAAFLALAFVLCVSYWELSYRTIYMCMAFLVISDLYYVDSTWHRNTINRESLVQYDSQRPELLSLANRFPILHDKLLVLDTAWKRSEELNLGMFLRLPIEFSNDSNNLLVDNPFRLIRTFPQVKDSVKRMETMGVDDVIEPGGKEVKYVAPLPFLKLYHHWVVTTASQDEARILNDSLFDFQKTLVVENSPFLSSGIQPVRDSIHLDEFTENELQITAWDGQASILLINDLYYPAWKAWIDGKPTNILRAFGALRAVALDPGKHTIVMRYESSSFEAGWKISATTLIASLVVLCFSRRKKGIT